MNKEVKFAIIGCGRISQNHLDAIEKAPHARLVATCDLVEEKAADAAEKYGCNYYTDIEKMLQSESIDVCCILTPSGMHCEHTCMVAKHGINVLCEKPLDITIEKVDKMIKCCKDNNVKLGCIFQRRTFEPAIQARKAVMHGWLGRITLADAYLKYYRNQQYYDSADWRATWEYDGGGALMNQGIHGVDMIAWIMGGIESVNAECSTMAWDIDVEDTAVVRVKYKNGAMGVIEGATSVYPGLETIFALHGTRGSIVFGDKEFYVWDLEDKNIKMPEVHDSMGGANCQYKETNVGHAYLVEDMALAVLYDRQPAISAEEGKKATEIILSIYESSKKKKEIFIT